MLHSRVALFVMTMLSKHVINMEWQCALQDFVCSITKIYIVNAYTYPYLFEHTADKGMLFYWDLFLEKCKKGIAFLNK